MSGHSKWSTIKRQKAVTDNRRAAVFTKLAKAITLAARDGGGDLDSNFKLRLAVQKGREANMPNDNIDRAIKKGTGEGNDSQLFEMMYEGYGPDGIALLIETVSDSKNRTASEIRNLLSKSGGSLASTNSVAWQFDHKGVINISAEKLPKEVENFQLELIDAGAQDVKEEPEGWTILTPKDTFAKVAEIVQKYAISPDSQGLEFIPQNTIPVKSRTAVEKLVE